MYGQQQRQPPKPGNGRVWPARERRSQNSPHFTGSITLPDGHVMRVSLWESYKDRGQGPFNGFSIKLSEDTRNGNPAQAQGAPYGGGGGYGVVNNPDGPLAQLRAGWYPFEQTSNTKVRRPNVALDGRWYFAGEQIGTVTHVALTVGYDRF